MDAFGDLDLDLGNPGDNQNRSGIGNTIDYDDDKNRAVEFLEKYITSDTHIHKYMNMLQDVADRRRKRVIVELDDVMTYTGDAEFVDKIQRNTHRYLEVFKNAIDELMVGMEPSDGIDIVEDVFDTLQATRVQAELNEQQMDGLNGGVGNQQHQRPSFPPELTRRYELNVIPPFKTSAVSLRKLSASQIGSSVRIKGIVTRISGVKPMVSIATYTCDSCGYEIYQEVIGKHFMPCAMCPSQECQANNSSGKLYMQTRGSKFVRYQEIKIQELPNQVPVGHIPRSMTVIARGDLTRKVNAGEVTTISGIFLPTPFTGVRAIRAGLIADTYLEAMDIDLDKKSYDDYELTEEMKELVEAASEDPNIYSKLSRSLAPEIFGHEDIKKALLLQLVGGVTKEMRDGMKIRGDINVLLMGDPGVAKSQLLKHICQVAPRCVYTTGKGSSGVGLTAAIMKDPVTGEMALEGGALVLADMGICCIDEFDKMEDGDRTAIHEVMEQQTVSIAKAGITTTLNARTAILAAANPLYGRYNRRKTPSENINLPAALLSRFDLLFLILDKADMDSDMSLARHVTYVHQNSMHPELDFEPLSSKFIRAYISQARKLQPSIPPALTSYIVQAYVDMRARDAENARDAGQQSVMTARQLLSILRLAQALARLRFSKAVSHEDVEEAIRLVHMCKSALMEEEEFIGEDVTTRVYSIIRDYATERGETTINYASVEKTLVTKGFTQDQIENCLEEYEAIDVWKINASRTQIAFVNAG